MRNSLVDQILTKSLLSCLSETREIKDEQLQLANFFFVLATAKLRVTIKYQDQSFEIDFSSLNSEYMDILFIPCTVTKRM